VSFRAESIRRPIMNEIVVRWGNPEDRGRITHILRLNSMPARNVPERTYIVAEERGEVLAVVSYRTRRKRLLLGSLAVDPWAGEHRFAVALYSGAKDLTREMGLREVEVDSDDKREYLLEAGYHRLVGGWRVDKMPPFYEYEELPKSGWRRVLFLWGAPNVPFFRAFRT
jgi:hypothetical protein